MKARTLLLCALLLALAACQPAASPPGVFEAGQVVMRPGERLDDMQSGSLMTFVRILQDNRCPADAVCISSGFVQALFAIEQGGATHEVILSLGDPAVGDDRMPVGEFTVTLIEVNPYPLASAPVDFDDYTVTLDLYAE